MTAASTGSPGGNPHSDRPNWRPAETAGIAPGLSAGVVPSEAWRLIEETDPALVAAWETAREAVDRHDSAWHRRNNDFQRDRNIQRRRITSPQAKALQEAEAAVAARLEALIAEGAVIYAGFPQGQLDGDPVVIPLAALAGWRPRGSRFTIRGVEFHEVRLYPAQGVKRPGRPPGRTRAPRNADDRLRAWLGEVDHGDKTIPEITAELTAAHPELRAWWAESTALKRVGALLPVRHNDNRP